MRIIFVRHGETDENVERRVQGQMDTRLNSRGEEQARELRSIINKKECIDAVFTSPLLRAARTAEIIADGRASVHCIPELMERYMGPVEGMLHSEAIAKRKKDNLPSLLCYGESLKDLEKRVLSGYQTVRRLAKENAFSTIVVVSHGSALANLFPLLIKSKLVGFDNAQVRLRYNQRPKLGNCSVTIIQDDNFIDYCQQWTESIERERSLV